MDHRGPASGKDDKYLDYPEWEDFLGNLEKLISAHDLGMLIVIGRERHQPALHLCGFFRTPQDSAGGRMLGTRIGKLMEEIRDELNRVMTQEITRQN